MDSSMQAIIEVRPSGPMSRQRVEAVERKGVGHPDSICDAAMEHASRALASAYQDRFGRVLHHNLDKALLVAGTASPMFGGGRISQPMRIVLGDRASEGCGGIRIDARGIVESAVKDWFRSHLPRIGEGQLIIQNELKPGSDELIGAIERGTALANDTSAAVGYAPLSETETLVLEADRFLASPAFKQRFPEAGEDVKVMAYRRNRDVDITIALAFVDAFVPDERHYFRRKEEMAEAVHAYLAARFRTVERISVALNILDKTGMGEAGSYLTVLGTSAESGDSGAVGRGNRVNGVIPLLRPVGTEAAAGKNAVGHTGKIYSLLTHALARELNQEVRGLEEVYVSLGSKIGQRIDKPAFQSVQVCLAPGVRLADVESPIRALLSARLETMPAFLERVQAGAFAIC